MAARGAEFLRDAAELARGADAPGLGPATMQIGAAERAGERHADAVGAAGAPLERP